MTNPKNTQWKKEDYDVILKQATRIFGDEDRAKMWLKQPAYGLGYRCPVEIDDARDVKDCLGRMEYGVYA